MPNKVRLQLSILLEGATAIGVGGDPFLYVSVNIHTVVLVNRVVLVPALTLATWVRAPALAPGRSSL